MEGKPVALPAKTNSCSSRDLSYLHDCLGLQCSPHLLHVKQAVSAIKYWKSDSSTKIPDNLIRIPRDASQALSWF